MGAEPGSQKRQPNVRKAVDWLLAKSEARKDGLITRTPFGSRPLHVWTRPDLAIPGLGAAQAACEEDRTEKIKDAATRGLDYLAQAQSSQGGWYRTSRAEGHDLQEILSTSLQLQAMSIIIASEQLRNGLSVALEVGFRFPEVELAKYEREPTPAPSPGRLTETAAAYCSRHWRIRGKKDSLGGKWFDYCQAEFSRDKRIVFGGNELFHYFYAQAVYTANDGVFGWLGHSEWLFDQLQSKQYKDGSWPPAADVPVQRFGLCNGPVVHHSPARPWLPSGGPSIVRHDGCFSQSFCVRIMGLK